MSATSLFRVLLVALCGLSSGAFAHEGPEHEIEELTEQMKVQGQTPDLLLQRAIEYNVLGKFADAAKDLERALELNAGSLPAQRELGQAYFALGKTNEALATVTKALQAPSDSIEQASLHMVRVTILRARRDYSKALHDAAEAIRKHPQNVEWYLVRSQLQLNLKQKQERVKGLEQGLQETGSGLLLAEWVDALIDNGQPSLALETIEKELPANRLKAAWLIRRAKVELASEKTEAARDDLTAAVDELNRRVATGTPDALLLADRGLALDLLGKRSDARRDYRAARDKGLADEWIRERIRVLRDKEDDD